MEAILVAAESAVVVVVFDVVGAKRTALIRRLQMAGRTHDPVTWSVLGDCLAPELVRSTAAATAQREPLECDDAESLTADCLLVPSTRAPRLTPFSAPLDAFETPTAALASMRVLRAVRTGRGACRRNTVHNAC